MIAARNAACGGITGDGIVCWWTVGEVGLMWIDGGGGTGLATIGGGITITEPPNGYPMWGPDGTNVLP
jgi:hypothetical protein